MNYLIFIVIITFITLNRHNCQYMKTILIVGVAFVTLREYVINNDMEYVILLDKRKPSKNIDSKRVIPCDFSSKKSILAALKLVKEGFNINGVIATYENYVLPAAIISKELGLLVFRSLQQRLVLIKF